MKARIQTCWTFAAAALLVIAFVAQGLAFIDANSATFDEAAHLGAGYSYLATGDFRLNQEHPPLVKELSALPVLLWYRLPFDPDPDLWRQAEAWSIGRDFLYGSSTPHDHILTVGRIPNLLFGFFLVGLIGWWAYRLWGKGAALVAMALAALEPNFVAHASLITLDLGITLFTFLTIYLLWEYVASPSRWLLVAIGVAAGLALATKFSALISAMVFGVVVALHVLGGGTIPLPGHDRLPQSQGLGARLASAIPFGRRALLLALLAVACCYFVYGFPLWGVGLRTQFERPASPAFFLGQVSSHGWWAYFPVAVLIKTPVGTLLLILASLVFPFAGTPLGRREAVFLLAPPALFLAGMAAGQVNLGLRYVLPIYPFLFVSASRLATVRSVAGVSGRWVPCVLVGLPLGLTAVSSLRVAPYQLTYFNEVAGGPERGYRYLGDSNLDWGQGLKGLKAYMERERLPMVYLSYFGTAPPAAYGIRYQYLPGFGQLQRPPSDHLPPGSEREILAISVTNLQGIYLPFPDLYSWLDSRTPLARIGNSIYVYDITGDADAHLQLAKLYLRTGLPHLARAELEKVLALSPAHPDAVELLSRELGTASEP